METKYFDKKSELSGSISESTVRGHKVYRCRLECGCTHNNNKRFGALVLTGDKVVSKLIRCKACRKEANNG
jgi:hypothetical protein